MSDNEELLSPPILSVNNKSLATAVQVPDNPQRKNNECIRTYVCLYWIRSLSLCCEGGVSCLCIVKEVCHVCVL